MRDTTLLHPRLQTIAAELVRRCAAEGLPVLITETLRTTAEQDALYAKGRTAPGGIVTNAKGATYQSPHQWGVAFDFCRNVKGRDYDDSDGFFGKVGKIGKSIGLFWGGDFKSITDKPHFELPEFMPGNSTKTLKATYGTPTVFIKSWEDEMSYEVFKEYMMRYMAEQAEKDPNPVKAEAEFKQAVAAGITDGTFPQSPATRQEAAVMVYRAFMKKAAQ